jgi:hypothetical protein
VENLRRLPSELADLPFAELHDAMTAWRVVMEKRNERQEEERKEAESRARREASMRG